MWPFKRKEEKRSAASGFTAEIMAARESYISGRSGIGQLTATVQSCVSLWEGGLSLADVKGTDVLDRRTLALTARALALRGEAVFLIRDRLIPCSDWDLKTRDAEPVAYRLSVSEAGGGRTETALAGEVLHFRIGSDVSAPYYGTAPLKRAQLTAGLLQAVETALSEVYETAPIASQIVPFPEAPETDLESLARGFRGNRGKVLIRESMNVTAAGGPGPMSDWKSNDLTPDLSKAMTRETLNQARDAICLAFGVLPGLGSAAATGPLVREAQRHVAQWQLQPIAAMMAEEASAKLGSSVTIDTLRPLQAFDAGGRARAITAIVGALAQAKEAGINPTQAMEMVDWGNEA